MELLTFAQVAAIVDETTQTVQRWARTEEMPVVHAGRKRRVPRAWVDKTGLWAQQ
jgi:excisionase family DNA binding protein